MRLTAFHGPFSKTLNRRKNFAKIFYASRGIPNFVPNFVPMATGVGRGKMIPKNFSINAKISQKISYASKNIAYFVSNFVAMATRIGRGTMRLVAFDSPFPKTLYRRKNLEKKFLRKPSDCHFCPKFRSHGNGCRSGKNATGSIRWRISKTHL